MNDEEMRIVRENIADDKERVRDHRLQLRHDVQMYGNLLDAVSTARKVAFVGSIPSIALIIWAAPSNEIWSPIIVAMFGLALLAIVGYFAPIISGLAANFWFPGCGVTQRRVAVILTLLANASYFGWVVYLIQ